MEKIYEIAKKHAVNSQLIKKLKEDRKKNLQQCENIGKNSLEWIGKKEDENCLVAIHEHIKSSAPYEIGDYPDYDDLLYNFGCQKCNTARQQKKKIGKLKREQGRLHSAMTNIGKSLLGGESEK